MADFNSAFTGAQIDAAIGAAQTATQPGDLATVATTGDYDDLANLPTLFDGSYNSLSDVPSSFTPSAHTHVLADITDAGTAAAANTGDFATAAQGDLADSAVQSDPTGVTGADAITNIISLTQAEYDAIGTPDAATLYVVTA
jgi:hypothetical protein